MTKHKLLSLVASAALLVGACTNDDPAGPDGEGSIELSPAQVTAIRNAVVELAGVDAELAWLADTIDIIVSAGVTATEVDVTTDLADGPFYAVSLQRTITTNTTATAAFDVILFNNPSNPTDFIIANGWINPGSGDTPPTTVSGTFGSPGANSIVNAHLFHISGDDVQAWRAGSGTATFSYAAAPAGTCSTVEDSESVTCDPADLTATFNVTNAAADGGGATGTRSASISASTVRGIIIRMVITGG